MPNPVPSLPDPDRTVDRPGDAKETNRGEETPGSGPPIELTGEHTPQAEGDSSVTGGYENSPPDVPGEPAVAGFEILGVLGRGGMGVVYRARQVALDRVVALKMILAGAHAREKDLERFRAEAKAVAKFQHPNLVQIHEVGEAGGLPYFSLEFVPGGTLSQKIAHEPQPPRFAAEVVVAVARAMQYAHARGIVHRDLKPANILLTEEGVPKVTDFGLAKRLERDSGQTQAGAVLGTPSYMAPEQASGDSDRVGPLADVYALGAILYDLMTGRPPFAGSSVMDTLDMVRTREPVPPTQLSGKLPRDLETICLKCLQKDPAKRYASAGDLADDLRRFLDGRPIVARPVGMFERAWRWARRNPGVAGLSTAVAALLVGVAVVTSVMSVRLAREKKEADEARIKAEDEEAKARLAADSEKLAKFKQADQKKVAIDTVRTMVFSVDDLMRDNARLFPLRTRIFNLVLASMDVIRDKTIADPLDDRTEGVAYTRMGEVYFRTGRIADAAVWLGKAFALYEAQEKEAGLTPDQRIAAVRSLAGISNLRADVEVRLGNAGTARDLYASALKLRQTRVELLKKEGSEDEITVAKRDVAMSHQLTGNAEMLLGDPAAAEKHYEAADAVLLSLPKPEHRFLDFRRERAELRVRIADAKLKRGDLVAARRDYDAALAERETLLSITKKKPYATKVRNEVAHSHLAIGDFELTARQDAAAASAAYRRALQMFSDIREADKEALSVARSLGATHYRLGVTARGGLLGRAMSRAHFQACLSLREELARTDPVDSQGQIELMLALGRVGRGADAVKIADALVAKSATDRRLLFQAACGYSVAGQRDKAVETLQSLVAKGWKDADALRTDPDLANARKDASFATILERVSK